MKISVVYKRSRLKVLQFLFIQPYHSSQEAGNSRDTKPLRFLKFA